MPLRAIQSHSLADQVFEQLTIEILANHYATETALPSERALSEIFGVNRHVVREALKRLEQVGFVKVSPGGRTRVMDFKRHAGLDLLELIADYARGGDDVAAVWLSVLEMRATIAADAARLCAERAKPALKQELLAISKQMSQTEDGEALLDLERQFWDRIMEGAGNIAYRLALNTMLKGTLAMGELAQQWSNYEVRNSEFRGPIAAAIASGDANLAEARTRTAMREALEVFTERVHPMVSRTPNIGRKQAKAALSKPRKRSGT